MRRCAACPTSAAGAAVGEDKVLLALLPAQGASNPGVGKVGEEKGAARSLQELFTSGGDNDCETGELHPVGQRLHRMDAVA